MADGREKLCRELADTEAVRAAKALRERLLARGTSPAEAEEAAEKEFLRVYEEVFEQAMLGGGS